MGLLLLPQPAILPERSAKQWQGNLATSGKQLNSSTNNLKKKKKRSTEDLNEKTYKVMGEPTSERLWKPPAHLGFGDAASCRLRPQRMALLPDGSGVEG